MYARVSTKAKPARKDCKTAEQYNTKLAAWEKKHQDTENQVLDLRRYAKAQKWQVIEYIDHETGKHADRDALQAMFTDASRHKFDVVLVWALDRFTREGVLDTFAHVKKLTDYGVQFESYTEPFFRTTGPAGELLMAVLAWVAKQERLRISERTIAGLERARKKGRVGGRPAKIFDRQRARELRNQNPPMSWRAIARDLSEHHGYKVAQSSIRKALSRVHKTSGGKRPKRGAVKT
jgi:DNA invertase Pin-like site-specific DNA recombinase